jgi:hypothetical protein
MVKAGNLKATSHPNAESSSMSPQPYVKESFTHCINQVTNKVPNSPAQGRARHQVSLLSILSTIRACCALALFHLAGCALALLCLAGCALAILCLSALASGGPKSAITALPPPSSPTRPRSSILIHSHPEVSLMAENDGHRWTDKKRMFFTQHPNDC